MELHLGATILAMWKPLGVVWGSILGSCWVDFGLPDAVGNFSAKLAPRLGESTIFEVPGGVKKEPKMAPKPASSGNLTPRASWGHLGLDFGAF